MRMRTSACAAALLLYAFLLPSVYGQATRYVDDDAPAGGDGTSWTTAFRHLHDALDSTTAGGTIRVAGGTYTPDTTGLSNPRSATFSLIAGVTIEGGYAGYGAPNPELRDIAVYQTVLSGDHNDDDDPNAEQALNSTCCRSLVGAVGCDNTTCEAAVCAEDPSCCSSGWDPDCASLAKVLCCMVCTDNLTKCDNSYHVSTAAGSAGPTTVLDGVTITAGYADGPIPDYRGGGMFIIDASPTLRNCIFRQNKGFSGAGVYSEGGSDPTVIDCAFIENEGFGFQITRGSDPILRNCSFVRNTETGVYATRGSAPMLIGCKFLGNGGGMYVHGSSPLLINCLFSGNEFWRGAGLYNTSTGTSTLINCTFSGNSSSSFGAGVYDGGGGMTLSNCLLWGNSDSTGMTESAQIRVDSVLPTIEHSCIQGWSGGYGGVGNFGADPLLVDPDGADDVLGTSDDSARLSAGSSCLDAGNNAAVTESTDLDGNPRIINGIVDVGAYEGPNQAFVIAPTRVDVPEGGQVFFTVALAMEPADTVLASVAFHEGDADITVQSGAALVFEPASFGVPQIVTLAAAEDPDPTNDSATIRVSASAIPAAYVIAVEIDNEPVPPVLYVDQLATGAAIGTSWSDAITDLQDALHIAAGGGGKFRQIWVAAGVYKPAGPMGDRLAAFDLIDGVGVYGGFLGTSHPLGGETSLDERNPSVNETILSGDLNGDDAPDFANREDNSYHVLTAAVVGETGILDGFVISGGRGEYPHHQGAGLYILGGGPTIRNCVFKDNRASYGSGIYSNISATTLKNCTFIATFLTAVWADDGLRTVTDCTFLDNYGGLLNSWRAVVALNDDDVVFTNCAWIGNSGGGLKADHATVLNSLFAGNTTEDGAGVDGGQLVLRNCTFTGNTAEEFGGAIRIESGEISNCTIAQNAAGRYAGGIYHSQPGEVTVVNSILWGNTAVFGGTDGAQVGSRYDGFSVNYSNMQGLSGAFQGTGNIDADPRFLDVDGPDNTLGTADDNVRLDLRSPCVDAGDNAAVPPDETDLDGDGDTIESIPFDAEGAPRFQDVPLTPDTGSGPSPIVDMGAYESPKQQFIINVDLVAIPEGGTATFSVHLALEPVGPMDVVVVWYSGDNDISVASGMPLQFDSGNYDTPRVVTLAAAEDADFVNGSATIQVQASGMPTAELTATEVDNGLVPPVLYVRAASAGGDGTSWSGALKELADALDMAANSNGVSQIWVAQGTYLPAPTGQNPDAMFQLVSGVGVYGGFAGNENIRDERDPSLSITILHGAGGRVVSGGGVDATAVLDGFTVTGGRADGVGPSGKGGAMIIINGSPTINNCKFEDNQATYIGGAVYIEDGDPEFTGCVFSDNWASPYDYNSVSGGALGASGGNIQLRGCTFTGNSARWDNGGGAAFDGGTATLIDCVFNGNSAGSGGGMSAWGGDVTLINCVFFDNSASELYDGSHGGGAVFSGNATLINCTFSENTTWYGGAAVHLYTGQLRLINSVLWGEDTNQLSSVGAWGWFGGTFDVHHSCVRTYSGVWGGEGNIAVDPRFDYHPERYLWLKLGSPAIDAGDNDALPASITTDLDGFERYYDGDEDGLVVVDMGAYEFVEGQDCNQNGIADVDDIADGSSSDCNTNTVPDECDLAEGASTDCDGNQVPDECDDDSDGDGVIDGCDGCPDDDAKGLPADNSLGGAPGQCGCGIEDVDTDSDGTADCIDGCRFDPNKFEPGNCGCGVSETGDEDGDGVLDCVDRCRGIDDTLFAPECATAIPTVGAWGLVVLALLLLAVGKVCFGGRRQQLR